MSGYKTRHFVTGNFTKHSQFLDDATYGLLLDNVVKATSDIFLRRASNGKILLGKRLGLPHSDWWFPGGRMMPGETAHASAARILKREVGIDIRSSLQASHGSSSSSVSVDTVGHYTFVWDTRTQEPVQNGTCDVSIVLCVTLHDESLLSEDLHRVPHEYSCLAWCDPRELLDASDNRTGASSGKPLAVERVTKTTTAPRSTKIDDDGDDDEAQRLNASDEAAAGDIASRPLHPALRRALIDLCAMDQWKELCKLMDVDEEEKREEHKAGEGCCSSSRRIVEQLRNYRDMLGKE